MFLSFAGNVTVIELIVFVKRAGGGAVEPQRDHVYVTRVLTEPSSLLEAAQPLPSPNSLFLVQLLQKHILDSFLKGYF